MSRNAMDTIRLPARLESLKLPSGARWIRAVGVACLDAELYRPNARLCGERRRDPRAIQLQRSHALEGQRIRASPHPGVEREPVERCRGKRRGLFRAR